MKNKNKNKRNKKRKERKSNNKYGMCNVLCKKYTIVYENEKQK